ncbi:MAG: hypothetical protein ABSD67_03970 [Terracidiphilus sp.]
MHDKNKYKDRGCDGRDASKENSGGILSGMGKIGRFFDRISRGRTIESLALNILPFSLLCASGIHHIIKARKEGDQFGLYWGIGLATSSLFFILLISMEICAVARRLKAESQRDL